MHQVPKGAVPLGLALLVCGVHGFFLPNVTQLERLLDRYQQEEPHARTRRAIPHADREEILQLHNKFRGQVYPPASNMEYMTWDEDLERSASAWAQECVWEHGPTHLLVSIGQNLAVHWGRYRSPGFHVQSWYDEVKDYTYPYPHECNPWCPERCSGTMCTHYTQIVWATTTKVGCAVHTCPSINVWGEVWENAVYLVCNYSPKGNWVGEAPYKSGHPCSECPTSYGGSCRNNLCYQEDTHPTNPEPDEANEVESAASPEGTQDRALAWTTRPQKAERIPAVSYMTQPVSCDTTLKDKCRGSTCNRYQCPEGCLSSRTKVFGTLFYESSSSICRAAIHYGVLDDRGGLVDITRNGKVPFFVKSARNGVESVSKYKPSSSFTVSKVKVQDVDCYATVSQLCPYEKPGTHCPRVRCPAHCRDEPAHRAPVFGTKIYTDTSSICRTAVHAGALRAGDSGFVDLMPVDRKKAYVGSLRNGVQSESLRTPQSGRAFRIFAVRQ